jgi:hypothetical protein
MSFSYRNADSMGETNPENKMRSLALSAIQNRTSMLFEARASYFGICVTSSPGNWQCGPDCSALRHLAEPNSDPLGLLDVACSLKNDVIFPGLLYDFAHHPDISGEQLANHDSSVIFIAILLIAAFAIFDFPNWEKGQSENESDDGTNKSRCHCRSRRKLT